MKRDLNVDTVQHIAALAHIRMDATEVVAMVADLNKIFDWIEQLNEVDITGVDPLTTADMALKMRDDVVNDETGAAQIRINLRNGRAILFNAPDQIDDFFTAPKFVGDNE